MTTITSNSAIQSVLFSKKLNAEGIKAIQREVVDPSNKCDFIDPKEQAVLANLADAVKRGEIQIIEDTTDDIDVEFELMNMVNTKVFQGSHSFWAGTYWNNDVLVVDNKGITWIEPWFTGNHIVRTVPFQAIESVSSFKGWINDLFVARVSGSGAAIDVTFEEDSGKPEEIVALINSRIEAWNKRVNKFQGKESATSLPLFEAGFQTKRSPTTGILYEIYLSENGSIAMSPVPDTPKK